MNNKRKIFLSKFISKHLRHEPETLGLTLQVGGWVLVTDLINRALAMGVAFTHEELCEVVETSDKQRYSFDSTKTLIRANQGHSVPVDLQLTAVSPPHVLYHGTAEQFVLAIKDAGLLPMQRHHVHLSADIETARRVGMRHGKPVIFAVDAPVMYEQGIEFFQSDNGVWLTAIVLPQFLTLLNS
ncbi:RNA 2'-phosphotransferase [Beggiatoa leptomitoformis]|uniref:Probable RNA 2'-phosphotransferase n=1 Tax=Beggiatoa leptomitoformis TaxID=288004 RepID=A0A2N9YCJ8_9GAMM|nr:RNA 2'-phosphotransferase [Beggiatoa leptomitoformis]ALG66503.1 RNA 2'-phosphotransferase [Beggiatoa leptomitoformis]AUI68201.1 RNA 2'-phosphotransferase [Beggiatoa leptomitoformis]